MPGELFRRINLDALYLPFLAVVLEVAARCQARGASYVATYGLRSFAEQEALHRKWKEGKGGRAAPGGLSAHQYGVAVDFCRDGDAAPGLQPRWDAPAYAVLGEEARAAGLAWGGSFGDAPHVQWPGYVSGAQLRPMRALFECVSEEEGMRRCWELLDAERSTSTWREANPRLAATLERLGFTTRAA